jgi:hypothetical protein
MANQVLGPDLNATSTALRLFANRGGKRTAFNESPAPQYGP